MRICLLVEGATGADCRAEQVAEELCSAGHSVAIVSCSSYGQTAGPWRVLGPGRSAQLARWLPRALASRWLRYAARRRACATKPEAIHALGRSMLRTGAKAARQTHAALLFDRAPDDGWAPRGTVARIRERRALRACSAVITASETEAEVLRERYGLPARPVVCRDVPPAARASPTPANLRERLRLADRPLILWHGDEPAPEHGLAAVRALADRPGVHLVVLGAEHWGCADRLSLEAEYRRCAGRLHLLRGVGDRRLPAYAREADVGLCLPSGRPPETQLRSLYRYAQAGLPVIVPPAGEAERLVRRFGFGWVTESLEPRQISDVLKLACGPERGTRREAAAQAGDALSWPAEARVLTGLYQRPDVRVLSSAGRLSALRSNAAALLRELRRRGIRGLRNPRAALHHVWGRHLRARGDYERSVAQFENTLRRTPADGHTALQRAAALKDAGRRAEAIEAYRSVVRSAVDRSDALVVTAAINLARLGIRSEPQEVLERISATADSASELTRAAELQAALGNVGEARRLIDRAVEREPHSAALLSLQTRVLEQAGEPQLALARARRSSDAESVRRLEGVMRLYDPTWLPKTRTLGQIAPQPGRVLHLLETSLPHARTGYAYRTATVLAAQRQAGLDPIAATRLGFPANRGIQEFAPSEIVEGIVHHRFALPGVRRYTAIAPDLQLERNLELLADLVQRTAPAVIQAATPHHNGLLGLALRRAFEIPMVYVVRGFPEMTWAVRSGGRESAVYGLRRAAETRCMLEADAVVTLSEVMKSHIVSRGVPAERVRVVPHMVDTDAIRPTERASELVRRYGLEDCAVVGYLGTLVDYEGIDLLLRALHELRFERPAIKGLIIGTGPAEAELRALARKLGLDQQVIFAGRVSHEEVNQHVALFDVYALPRHGHEVCRWVTPLKPYEAMASGRCLLTSDVEALAETVADDCGQTFAGGEVGALADALRRLAGDPERRALLGRAGRAKVVHQHSQRALAEVAAAPARELMERAAGARTGAPLPARSPVGADL